MADGYTVGTGKQDVILNPNGPGFQSVWEFPVVVTSGPAQGSRFTVTVPQEGLSADAVHTAITDQLATLEDIHSR
jgi:hypothetical protein